MTIPSFEELDVKITPQLRTFLRAELAQAVHFEALDGELWNPHKIAAAIRDNPDIPGSASDDTIVRFLSDLSPHQTRRAALEAIAGFLLAFDFISERDLRHYGHPSYDRAASAVADLFQSNIDEALNESLLGAHRFFQTMGHERLVEWLLTIGSPDDGQSVSVDLTVAVFQLDDPDYFKEEYEILDPLSYPLVRDYVQEIEPEVNGTSTGFGVITSSAAFAVIGGDEESLQGVIMIDEMHRHDADHVGMCARYSSGFIRVENGAPILRDAPMTELEIARRYAERLTFYPQGKPTERLPKIDADVIDSSNRIQKGRGLTFQGAVDGRMSEKDQTYLEAEQYEMEVEAALAKCPNETARLALSIDLWRVDHAVAAIEAGADVNAIHEKRSIPMVHAAASLGMRKVVDAMLEQDVDLTVRDRFNRLPSACMGETERTIKLRDDLAAAQAAQFKEKGLDPQRPQSPENS